MERCSYGVGNNFIWSNEKSVSGVDQNKNVNTVGRLKDTWQSKQKSD